MSGRKASSTATCSQNDLLALTPSECPVFSEEEYVKINPESCTGPITLLRRTHAVRQRDVYYKGPQCYKASESLVESVGAAVDFAMFARATVATRDLGSLTVELLKSEDGAQQIGAIRMRETAALCKFEELSNLDWDNLGPATKECQPLGLAQILQPERGETLHGDKDCNTSVQRIAMMSTATCHSPEPALMTVESVAGEKNYYRLRRVNSPIKVYAKRNGIKGPECIWKGESNYVVGEAVSLPPVLNVVNLGAGRLKLRALQMDGINLMTFGTSAWVDTKIGFRCYGPGIIEPGDTPYCAGGRGMNGDGVNGVGYSDANCTQSVEFGKASSVPAERLIRSGGPCTYTLRHLVPGPVFIKDGTGKCVSSGGKLMRWEVVPGETYLEPMEWVNLPPVKGEGCEITQAVCVNDPSKVGKFPESSANASLGQSQCFARAAHYGTSCGNPPGTPSKATFLPGDGTSSSTTYSASGCSVILKQCDAHPEAVGTRADNFEGAATNLQRCMDRAKEYAIWCNNPRAVVTKTSYFEAGLLVRSNFAALPL
jgi:hypothetical protein